MNDNIINFIGGGIKCDNPECDFVNQEVKIEDYKDWLNKPCPKCGSNLLTQADYDNVQMLLNLVDIINENKDIFPDTEDMQNNSDEMSTVTFNMNGTGSMDVEINMWHKTNILIGRKIIYDLW